MTLDSLFGPLGPGNIKTTLAQDRGDYYYSPPWKGYSYGHEHKGYKSALSAITLLAFLFFLHVLQNCLNDQLRNQTPLIIMMTTTTTTTTSGQKRQRREGGINNNNPENLKSSQSNPETRNHQTELVPYYDFLVDVTDGPTLADDVDYKDIIFKLENELPSLFNKSEARNKQRNYPASNKTRRTINNSHHKYLKDFWTEEESELSCCKQLVCEMELFLMDKPYASHVSRSVGLTCGLVGENELGIGGCTEAKLYCEGIIGQEGLAKTLRKSLAHLISHRPDADLN